MTATITKARKALLTLMAASVLFGIFPNTAEAATTSVQATAICQAPYGTIENLVSISGPVGQWYAARGVYLSPASGKKQYGRWEIGQVTRVGYSGNAVSSIVLPAFIKTKDFVGTGQRIVQVQVKRWNGSSWVDSRFYWSNHDQHVNGQYWRAAEPHCFAT